MNTRTFIKSVTALLLTPWKALASRAPRKYEVFPKLPEECIGLWVTTSHPDGAHLNPVKVIMVVKYEDDVSGLDGKIVHLTNCRRNMFWGECLDGKRILLCMDGPWVNIGSNWPDPFVQDVRFWNRP